MISDSRASIARLGSTVLAVFFSVMIVVPSHVIAAHHGDQLTSNKNESQHSSKLSNKHHRSHHQSQRSAQAKQSSHGKSSHAAHAHHQKKTHVSAPLHPSRAPVTQETLKVENVNVASAPIYSLKGVEKRLVSFVRNMVTKLKYTRYQFGGGKIDDEKGVYVVDCSRYVDYILEATYPKAYSNLVAWSQTDRPSTNDYYHYLSNLSHNSVGYWSQVDKVQTLRPGDILVFRYLNQRGRETGGHIMIVMDAPRQDGDVYFVRIADSAPGAHSSDTRSSHHSGIGIGTLLLKVDPATSQPIAYAWKAGSRWQENVNIAMGRPFEADDANGLSSFTDWV